MQGTPRANSSTKSSKGSARQERPGLPEASSPIVGAGPHVLCGQIRIAGYYSSTSSTVLPLYVPQLGQTWCGSLASPHSGQAITLGPATFWWVLLLSLFDLDLFRFGTAMVVLPAHSTYHTRPRWRVIGAYSLIAASGFPPNPGAETVSLGMPGSIEIIGTLRVSADFVKRCFGNQIPQSRACQKDLDKKYPPKYGGCHLVCQCHMLPGATVDAAALWVHQYVIAGW